MWRTAQIALGLALVCVASCGGSSDGGDSATRAPDDPIRVASFDFTESVVLGELFAQALESDGFPVERVLDLGPREVVQPALQLGVVDVVPEYLGSMLAFVSVQEATTSFDVDITLDRLRQRVSGRDLSVLEPAAAENANVLVMTAERAAVLGVGKTSDLQALAPGLVFSGPPECPDRTFCLQGLEDVYGLEFGEFVPLGTAEIRAEALRRGEVEVALLFGTDAQLIGNEFVVLDDDRDLQPAENIVAVVRSAVVESHGDGVADRLGEVTSRLTTDDLAELNRRIDIDGEVASAAAAEWLAAEGLVG